MKKYCWCYCSQGDKRKYWGEFPKTLRGVAVIQEGTTSA